MTASAQDAYSLYLPCRQFPRRPGYPLHTVFAGSFKGEEALVRALAWAHAYLQQGIAGSAVIRKHAP